MILLVACLLLVEGIIGMRIYEFLTVRREKLALFATSQLQQQEDIRRFLGLLRDSEFQAQDNVGDASRAQALQTQSLDWLNVHEQSAATEEQKIAVQRLRTETLEYWAEFSNPTNRGLRVTQIADDLAALNETYEKGRFIKTASRIRTVSRREGIVLFALAPLAAGLAWLGYIVWVLPLRLRLAENQRLLEQSEKLAALGTLAAGVAHEIRNPLTAIKARLYTIRKSSAGNATAVRDLGVVGQEIDRLDGIVRDMLEYARPPEPQLTSVELAGFLYETAEFLKEEVSARGAHIEMQADSSAIAFADATQLRQIVFNLVHNALDSFDGRPGNILLAVAVSDEAHGKLGAPHAILSVADNGPGIAPEARSRLFDPFFTTKKTGTGLGLSIVLRLVENQRGKISYRSVPGEGTLFEVRLPLVEKIIKTPKLNLK
jgi:signal transduction histidine kinase